MKSTRLLALGLFGMTLLGGVAAADKKFVGYSVDGSTFKRGFVMDTSFHHDPNVPMYGDTAVFATSPTKILFINPCTNGCKVKPGNGDDNRQTPDVSQIAQQATTLSKYPRDATHWAAVMSCLKDVYKAWNITITDQDPGAAAHYEVIVTGSSAVALMGSNGNGVGGVAPLGCTDIGSCDAYIANTVVYDFASSWQGASADNEDCSTIAQEIAHTWALDHVVDKTDPMTYNPYSGRRYYHNNEACGSDCQGGQSPLQLTCTGSNDSTATHACYGTGVTTQNELDTINALFGPAGASSDTTPPVVMITSPADGSAVTPGFMVRTTITDNVSVARAELRLDGSLVQTQTAFPYTFTTANTLAAGQHTIEVTAYDDAGNSAKDTATVTYAMCTQATDCASGDTCVNGQCMAGSGTPGGLGSTCTAPSDCQSGECANDGTGMYCVVACDVMTNSCPNGFSCLPAGTGGVCFPESGNGTGCGCNSSTSSGGFVLFGLTVLGLVGTSRRRRR